MPKACGVCMGCLCVWGPSEDKVVKFLTNRLFFFFHYYVLSTNIKTEEFELLTLILKNLPVMLICVSHELNLREVVRLAFVSG